MARRSTSPPRAPARLTADDIQRAIPRLQRRIQEIEEFDPSTVQRSGDPRIAAIEVAIDEALVETFGPDTLDYHRYRGAANFNRGSLYLNRPTPLGEIQMALAQSRERSLALLQQAIRSLGERSEELGSPTEAAPDRNLAQDQVEATASRIFIVHGHDVAAREEVARFIDRAGLEPIILHEQASGGRTVIEKLEHYSDVGFAVVLLTPDDVGGPVGGKMKPRARQNVIAELFYFVGRLGRSKVCPLMKGEVEIPSDTLGVVYAPMDEHGGWKQRLLTELQEAGYKLDWERALSNRAKS